MEDIGKQVAALVRTWKRVWQEDECTKNLPGHEYEYEAVMRIFIVDKRSLDRILYANLGDSMIDIRRLHSGKHVAFWIACDGKEIFAEP